MSDDDKPVIATGKRTVEQMKQVLANPLLLAGIHIHAIEFLPEVPCWHVECRKGEHYLRALLMPRSIMIKVDGVQVLEAKLSRPLAPHEFAITIVESFGDPIRTGGLLQ